ncbi:hypothetical protein [Paenibacillus donghaensis]|uniref:Uncharacterized protein n=1 Tax=Paenibacillus donghaensis TaxID=414771 RepID=A0A2Z2KCA6_9BACL|nr:hypothetical protein [Paenibacillus donghaensis]ASA19569.1 hypothetical protein B9T62_01270 [Paenibacillus donghaensis]
MIVVAVTPFGRSRVKLFALLLDPVRPVLVGIDTVVNLVSAAEIIEEKLKEKANTILKRAISDFFIL